MPTTADPRTVPLNIWVADQAATASGVRRQLAGRLVETYTAPGATVIDLSPGRGEVLAAAASAKRGAVALRQPPGCAGRPRTPALDAIAGSAELAFALPPASHLRPARPHPLSATAATILAQRAVPLLRPGGYLAVGTLGRAPGTRRDPVAAAVTAASQAGLSYYQHLVVLLDTDLDPEGSPQSRRPRLAHVDLLVFNKVSQ
jgi:hypothetical protein